MTPKRSVLLFFALAYGISAILWAPLYLFDELPVNSTLLIIPGGFGPMIAAAIAIRLSNHSVRQWVLSTFMVKIHPLLLLGVFLLPLIIGVLAIWMYLLMNGQGLGDYSLPTPLINYPILLGLIFFVGGGQEELGWRGFALPRLLTIYSPVVASIILGLAWSFWHVPLFFSPHAIQNQIPFFWYVLNTIFFSGILTKIYLHNRNVVLPMIVHAGLNAIGNYAPTSLTEIYPYLTGSSFLVWMGLRFFWKK